MTEASQPSAPDAPQVSSGGEPELRVTTLELFFDLIFAFTLTQLAVLLGGDLTGARVIQVLLIFGLLWWMYGGYAWLTNTRAPTRSPERLLLVLGMAGFLIVGLAIPRGFGRDEVALGLGYLLVVVVHSCLYARVNPNIWRIAPFNVTSALLVIVAGIVGGGAQYALWAAALAIQAGAPLVVRLGGRFEIRPSHFAERHGALIIVAIGESVAAIGIGASGRAVDVRLVVAATAGLALSVTLWWMYFGNGDDEHGEQSMRAASPEARPRLALSAYFYAHMPMLLGIVFVAAGVAAEVAASGHGAGGLRPAIALGVGTAAFIGGTVAFRAALKTGPLRLRLATAIFALATIALGALVAIEAQLVTLTAGLAVMLAAEGLSQPRQVPAGPQADEPAAVSARLTPRGQPADAIAEAEDDISREPQADNQAGPDISDAAS
jgi:low temperature requirement protein LtrA